MNKRKSASSCTKCSGCGNNIKCGDDLLNIGYYGGRFSSWVKLCRDCVHKAHRMMYNYTEGD